MPRLYPDLKGARRRTIARDVLLVTSLILLAWLALKVHDDVLALKGIAGGVVHAGRSVQEGFGAAGRAVSGVPIIGGTLAHGLRSAGSNTGGAAVAAGYQGERDIERAATLIGWLTFLLPAALILQRYVPRRVRQINRVTAAARVLQPRTGEDHRRLIAQRAAFSLPYQQLLRHTRDPLADLQAGRYEPLVAALLEDAGLADRESPRRRGEDG